MTSANWRKFDELCIQNIDIIKNKSSFQIHFLKLLNEFHPYIELSAV